MSDANSAAFTTQPDAMEPETEPKSIGRSHVHYLGSSWAMLITE